MWKGKTRGGVSGYLFFIYLDIGHRTVDHHLISYSHTIPPFIYRYAM